MAIRINDNSSNFTGRMGAAIGSFSSALSGDVTNPGLNIDGSLQRAMGSFNVSFKDSGSWPLNGWALSGGYMISGAASQLVDEPDLTYNAEKDILIPQLFGIIDSNVMEGFAGYYKNVKDINPQIKLLPYFISLQIEKTSTTGLNWERICYDIVNSASKGSSQWYLVNSSSSIVENHPNGDHHRVNCYCPQFLDDNSFGRNYVQQFYEDLYQALAEPNANGTVLEYADGFFIDVLPPAPQQVYVDGSGGTNETNRDFNRDSAADGRTDETIPADTSDEDGYGGCRMMRRGAVQWIDEMENRFGPDFVLFRNSSRDGLDYDFTLNNGDPLDQSEFYQRWGGGIQENAQQDLGIVKSGSGYNVNFNGFSTFCRRLQRIKSSNELAATHPWGGYAPHAVVVEVTVNSSPWDQTDYEYVRFIAGCCVFNGAALGAAVNKLNPFPRIDEYMYPWGNPLSTYPNPGTLNVSTDNSFTLRSPDFQSGAADVMFIEFENVIWVLRYDFPSTGANAFGTGASVAIDLPNPTPDVVLKKWQFPDFTTTYTNPNNSLLQTRNQSPTVNDGSEVTDNGAFGSISLPPASARMLLRVDA